jgi:hypothetical protein
MNRAILQISWIDAKVVFDTLTSIQNALQYSTEPTEILLLLNEQTFIDTPLEGEPADMWRYFIDHPLIKQCHIKRFTNSDPFLGAANSRRDYITKEGLTYWMESDCLVPIELFYVAENFHKTHTERPYVMTFAIRKMWPGWESVEHINVQTLPNLDALDTNDPEKAFLRCDGPMSLEKLYEFNDRQGDPVIVQLKAPRVEGAMTILSEGLPEHLICPDIDFYHEDYNLELSMRYYRIPQFHVSNILKGHDMRNPNKRSNLAAKSSFSKEGEEKRDKCQKMMIEWATKLYNGGFNK